MGIDKGAVSLLCELKKEYDFGGAILQLGKQTVYVNVSQLRAILKSFDFQVPVEQLSELNDEVLFRTLGFDRVESFDVNDFEEACHIHDFNNPVLGALKGRYDVVFDGGTLEHIFNFPQALINVFDLLKEGVIVIHGSPSHNHVDHGFYMFSPTIFSDYYKANQFRILKLYIFECGPSRDADWIIYNYDPGSIAHLSMGGWGRKLLGIWCVAQKTNDSTGGVVPQQGSYVVA